MIPIHTKRQWEAKFFRCDMQCWYCRIALTLKEAIKDHRVPLARGGSDAISNIVPACLECSRFKGNMTEPEFQAKHKAFSTNLTKFAHCPPSNYEIPSQVEKLADEDSRERVILPSGVRTIVVWSLRESQQERHLEQGIKKLAVKKAIPLQSLHRSKETA